MSEYDKVCIETFLRDQLKLFPEKVAETPEEAEDFLDMCMAAVCKNMKEVREYFDETGADISGMSKEELEQMCEEIQMYRELGANGVVIGALTPDGDLDLDAMRRLMNCAGNMDVTLHRAFDMTRDPFAAMEDAIRLGCKTILTSGQQKDPLTGAELLRELFEKADDRIDIMAGCGVKKWNIQEIHDKTGIVVFHTTGRKGVLDSGMRYRKQTVAMGLPSLSEYELWQTDEEEFRACAQIVHSLAAGAGQ